MTEATDTPAPKPRRPRLPSSPQGWLIVLSVIAVMLVGLFAVGLRYGVNSAPGLLFVEARVNGLKIGRFGKLKIEGLSGDLWRNLGVRRLTITDEKGVWLTADDLHMKWNYPELFVRRFHADEITARQVTVLRRPTLTPKTTSKGMPVSVDIDRLGFRLETKEAFSYSRGLFDVGGQVQVVRNGPLDVKVSAASRLHEGDRLVAAIEAGKGRPFKLLADAREARGGAIAGALGLPSNQPFSLDVQASGDGSEGRFNVVAVSGPTRPAEAKGTWNKTGGSAQGRFSLSASRLTQGLARRFGGDVAFKGTGRKVKSGLFQIDAGATSDVLTLRAVGEADIGRRVTGKDGLKLSVSTGALDRLTSKIVGGSATTQGVLIGDQASWTYAGDLAATKFTMADYHLARVHGPVTVGMKAGELTIQTALTGAGGGGQGVVSALLGQSPFADAEVSRLRDGRFLIRRVKATGDGLRLDGTGERTLLGGLSFKGDAVMANFRSIRLGAKGGAKLSWSASQAGGGGKPWLFTVDAVGDDFATGWGELDRLLGGSPRLKGRAELKGGVVTVADAQMTGERGSAKTSGQIGPNGALQLKLDWTATGPFRAGPLEVTGEAKGDGGVTGTISAPRADLTAEFAAIDLPNLPLRQAKVTVSFVRGPNGTDGSASIEAGSEYGPARGRTDFTFVQGGLSLSGLDVDAGGVKATGSAALQKGTPSSANLIVSVRTGALLTQGQIDGTAVLVDAPGGTQAALNLTARGAVIRGAGGLRLGRAEITANGPLKRLPVTIDGRGAYGENRWRFKGSGVYAGTDGGMGLALDGEGRFGSADFRTLETARVGFVGKEKSLDVKLEVEGGRADIVARVEDGRADITADLVKVSLGALNEDLAGMADAKITLKGEGDRLTGTLEASLSDARARGAGKASSVNAKVTARLNDATLDITAGATNASGLKSEAVLSLPVVASAAPLRLAIVRNQPVRGRFTASGEVRPLWDLLVGGERSVSGNAAVNATLAGTLGDPRLEGRAALSGGVFEDGQLGLALRDMSVNAVLEDNTIDVTGFSATDGAGGRLTGGGRFSLLRNGVSTFRLSLQDFQLIKNDAVTATASGKALLSRAADGNVELSGDLTIDRATIAADPPTPSGVVPMAVIERNKPGAGEGDIAPEERKGLVVALNVSLKAGRRIFVEGRGLDAELSLDARVTGTTAKPVLDGVAKVVRGEYDFAGKRFEFDQRSAVYLAALPERIRLDLTATRDDPSLTAVIRVKGTAAKPEITLTSTPVLPQDEVMSRVLFGTSAAQLSPLEAAQLASAIAALAGGGGFDVIGNLRSFAGLDRLTFAGGGEGGAMTIAGGKYLTDDVYLEIIGGGVDGPAAQVEWRVRRNLSIVSRLQGENSKLSVRWRKDY